MGKNLIQQARGKGGPTYRAPSHNYKGSARHKEYSKETVNGVIMDFVHCPGHSAPLAYVEYETGEPCLMLAPEGIKVGDKIITGEKASIKGGNTLPLKNIPDGTLIFNIERVVGDGGKFVRSSGVSARVLSHSKNHVTVILPSKKQKILSGNCRATIGTLAGGGRKEKPIVKAGKKYHIMKARNKLYPKTRGVAMNAVDHPFGGSRSLRKGRPTQSPRSAPPGRKVGKIAPRRTGKRK